MKKKVANAKDFLNWAGVLFIAFVMVLPTVNVIADTSKDIKSLNNGKVGPDIGALDDLPFVEAFEEGIMPPTGWDLQIDNPDYTWQITEDIVHSGTYAGFVPKMTTQKQDEWLISPYIALDGAYVEVKLDFWCNTSLRYTYGTVKVYVSTDDNFQESEVIWNILSDEDPGEWGEMLWRNKVLYLNESIGETVRIAWRYQAEVRFQSFALDDILVYAGEYDPPTIEIGEITGKDGTLSTGPIVSAEIINTGGNASNVDWTIKATGNAILKKVNMTGNGTIPELLKGSIEVVQTFITNPKQTVLISLLTINVTAVENTFGFSASKNATGILIGWKIFFIKEV